MAEYFFDICCIKKYNYPNMKDNMIRFINNFQTIKQFNGNIDKYLLVPKKNNNEYVFCLYFSCFNHSELIELITDIKGSNFYISFITKEVDNNIMYIYNNLANYKEMSETNRGIYRNHIRLFQEINGNDKYLHQVLEKTTKFKIMV
jgi:hypothetical protein